MPLFVVVRDGLASGVAMTHNIDRAIEANESRRFLPHEVFAMPEKSARIDPAKAGLPIRTLQTGQPIEKSSRGCDSESGLPRLVGCLRWKIPSVVMKS